MGDASSDAFGFLYEDMQLGCAGEGERFGSPAPRPLILSRQLCGFTEQCGDELVIIHSRMLPGARKRIRSPQLTDLQGFLAVQDVSFRFGLVSVATWCSSRLQG